MSDIQRADWGSRLDQWSCLRSKSFPEQVGTPAAEAPDPSGTVAPEPMVAQEEEEGEDDDWEAMDLDDLRLPGQKAADKKQVSKFF